MLLAAIAAFAFTLVTIPVLNSIAPRLGLLDKPTGRKQHEGAVPLTGGLAMVLAFLAAVHLFDLMDRPSAGLLAGLTILLLVGVVDDLKDLPARHKFLAQILVAIIVLKADGISLSSLGNLFGAGLVPLGVAGAFVTVFAVVGVVNAVNMSDGLDGIGGGFALTALSGLAVIALLGGHLEDAQLLVALAGGVLAFLGFNLRTPWRKRAAIFMGDAGSMCLGFAIAYFSIKLTQGDGVRASPVTALWLLALPLMDTISVMLRRLFKGRNPFAADREHLHHIFLLAGFTPAATAAILIMASAGFAALGVLGWYLGVPEPIMFLAFIAAFVGYFTVMRHAWKVMRALRKIPH